MSITSTLQQHHHHCDDLFAEAEGACADGNWSAGRAAFDHFCASLESHFSTEESVLFPAFEAATGMQGGPTQVMRLEHEQMRGLLVEMKYAAHSEDADRFAGAADALLILMQQHNLKEENILYPMADRAVGADVHAMLTQRLEVACHV